MLTMKKRTINLIGFAILFCLSAFALLIFIPRKYQVPHLQNSESISYWNLSTGSRIAYTLVKAKKAGRPFPIIYVNGGPGGSVTDEIISSLSKLSDDGYIIYFYDQIGSGRSSRLDDINDYTAQRHKKDLEEIIQKTGADKVILIGQSWGAVLSLFAAADNSDKIEKIIFTGPGPIFPIHKELTSLRPPDSLQLKMPYYTNADGNKKATNVRAKAIEFFAEKFGWKLAPDEEADDFSVYRNTLVNRSTVCDTSKIPKASAGTGFYVQVMTMKSISQMPDPRPKLLNCKIPALLLKGQCDNQPWGYITEYFRLFPNHQFTIIPDAGHFIFLEQPEAYLRSIRDFLNN